MSWRSSLSVAFVTSICALACGEKERPPSLSSNPDSGNGLGGETAAGGSKATGGSKGTGGSKATGGSTSTGGAADTGGQSGDGGTTAGTGGALPTLPGTYKMVQLVEEAPWEAVPDPTGMTVGSDGQVFILTYQTIWLYKDGVLSEYFTTDDLVGSVGGSGISDIDWGSDNKLHVACNTGEVVTVDGPHSIELVSGAVANDFFGMAASPEEMAFVGWGGLWTRMGTPYTNTITNTYFESEVHGSTDCATEDFAVQKNGDFFYLVGCNMSQIVTGNINGGALHEIPTVKDAPNRLNANNFECVTRDTKDGFYVVTKDDGVEYYVNPFPRLVHMTRETTENTGFQIVTTLPDISSIEKSQSNVGLFNLCAMAVAPTGEIYIRGERQLWRVDPPSP